MKIESLIRMFVVLVTVLAPFGVSIAGEPLVVVVMDPLSKPLSCDCVLGYAQRDYKVLAEHLEPLLDRKVKVVWFESLTKALSETDGKADLVIGKHSVVLADAKETSLELQPLASLTGQEGEVTQTGLIVVRRDDRAQELSDLKGYRFLMGPTSAAEKSSAADLALVASGVKLAGERERCNACSEAVSMLMKIPKDEKAAAVISSYAQPLLAGCGSIRKGDLRVVGETDPIPFVTAFVNDGLPPNERKALLDAMVAVSEQPEVRKQMETLIGFVQWEDPKPALSKKEVRRQGEPNVGKLSSGSVNHNQGWPQFRGPSRDGRVAWLPDRLPDLEKELAWKVDLSSDGIGGVMATDEMVVIGYRDALDRRDCFSAFQLDDGTPLWTYQYTAESRLDYGNSPRATPLYADGVIVTFGAGGLLTALDAASGFAIWTIDVMDRYGARSPDWGFCGSPLVMDETIYIQAGPDAAVVAIDLFNGETKWQVSGNQSAYTSLIAMQDGKWLVGVDDKGYFARQRSDGKLVWSHSPEYSGDFGVPSPVSAGNRAVFASENNGLSSFTLDGNSLPEKPDAINEMVIPDTHTPVRVSDQLLVAFEGLRALDLKTMATSWLIAENHITGYASVIASNDRALVTTERGQWLLVDTSGPSGRVLDQCSLSGKAVRLLSHPAVSGKRLLVRVGSQLRCYKMPL